MLRSGRARDLVQLALARNPAIQAARARWRATAARIAQRGALPDPRLTFGYFLEEIETRTGPQEARLGVQQGFPWPGLLAARENAAAYAAHAAWRHLDAVQLTTIDRLLATLYELRYLDRTIDITRENLELLRSFEEVIRARYRVGTGSHPELIRVQVALGQLEDRVSQLTALRPSQLAQVNAILARDADAEIPTPLELPDRVATGEVEPLVAVAREANPDLLALLDRQEEQAELAKAARWSGYPDFAVGIETIFTGEAINRSTRGSGDDPVILTLGVSVPLGRRKYRAAVEEAEAQRAALEREHDASLRDLTAAIHRAWFDHHDADRRTRLYRDALIPKAEESLRASLTGFRTGEATFLDLLDTERTLLEFAISEERARADRGRALSRLAALAGAEFPTRGVTPDSTPEDEEGGPR